MQVDNIDAMGTTISRYDYTYDAAGRRISKNDEIYTYNTRSELTDATSSVDANYRYAYDFDDIGNRETSMEREAAAVDYAVNNLNQYTSIASQPSQLSQPSQSTFTPTYDADGNQTLVKTKTGIWQITYNAENRPVKWTCDTTNLVMAFDRMGRRVLSEVQVNDAPIKTETYVYDGYTCILRQTTIHTNAVPTTIRDTFVWDPTEPVATHPLVWNRVEEKSSTRETHPTAFYFHDGNKNVSDVVSSTDETKAHYTYAPFGDCMPTGALAQSNPWRFSSEYADDELGCVYYNYRHYEPMMGRWLSRDPISDEWYDFELYIFVHNRCVGNVDCFGLFDDGGCEMKRCVEWRVEYERVDEDSGLNLFGNVYFGSTRPNHPIYREKRVCVREECIKGHKDFPNNGTGCPFDYTKEDHDPETDPMNFPKGTKHHFRKLSDVEDDIRKLFTRKECDADAFQRLLHQLQDYYAHVRGKPWRWWTLGHILALHGPDRDKNSQERDWPDAAAATQRWLDEWSKHCKLKSDCKCEWEWQD